MRATMTRLGGWATMLLRQGTSANALCTTLTRSDGMGKRAANCFSWADTQIMRVVQAASTASANQALVRINQGACGLKPKPCTV